MTHKCEFNCQARSLRLCKTGRYWSRRRRRRKCFSVYTPVTTFTPLLVINYSNVPFSVLRHWTNGLFLHIWFAHWIEKRRPCKLPWQVRWVKKLKKPTKKRVLCWGCWQKNKTKKNKPLEAVNFTTLLFVEETRAWLFVNWILLFYLLSFMWPQSWCLEFFFFLSTFFHKWASAALIVLSSALSVPVFFPRRVFSYSGQRLSNAALSEGKMDWFRFQSGHKNNNNNKKPVWKTTNLALWCMLGNLKLCAGA